MRRIKASDLCYSCRRLHATGDKSVDDFLTICYNDPGQFLDGGRMEQGIVGILNRAIVMGDGCTTCGAKVLDWAKDVGLR